MKCPNCGAVNFGTTKACECGYKFSSKQVREARKTKTGQYEQARVKETLIRCVKELEASPPGDYFLDVRFQRVASMLQATGFSKLQGLAAQCARAAKPYGMSPDEQHQAKLAFVAAARAFLEQIDTFRSHAMHISLLANDLHCRYCNQPNSSDKWPLQGDRVGFVYNEEPGAHSLEIYCPHCKKNWYVNWDRDPGPIEPLGF